MRTLPITRPCSGMVSFSPAFVVDEDVMLPPSSRFSTTQSVSLLFESSELARFKNEARVVHSGTDRLCPADMKGRVGTWSEVRNADENRYTDGHRMPTDTKKRTNERPLLHMLVMVLRTGGSESLSRCGEGDVLMVDGVRIETVDDVFAHNKQHVAVTYSMGERVERAG